MKKYSWYYFLPLLLIIGVVPLIIYAKNVDLSGTMQLLFWTGASKYLDFFSFWKSFFLFILTILASINYIKLTLLNRLSFKNEIKYYIPLGIYAVFILLSTTLAVDVRTAMFGFVDMYQGVWILMSYLMLTVITINMINDEKDTRLLLYAFVFLVMVESVFAVSQFLGFDLYQTRLGYKLLIPSYLDINGVLRFNYSKYLVYGTIYNSNLVGSLIVLLIPIIYLFFITSKKISGRIVGLISLILCFFMSYGCRSKAGYVGLIVVILLSIILCRKSILRHWKLSVGILVAVIIALIPTSIFLHIGFTDLIAKINPFNQNVLNLQKNSYNNDLKFESIELGSDTVRIYTTKEEVIIKLTDNEVYFVDEKGERLPMTLYKEDMLVIDAPNHGYLRVIERLKGKAFSVVTGWDAFGTLDFYKSKDGMKIVSGGTRLTTPIVAKTFKPFSKYEDVATGRGFIWSRAICLLPKYMFKGAGPDNFIYVFPQDDFVAKLNFGISASSVIDKPHSMYLQIAINTGVLSLITLLVLWSMYIASSLKIYFNSNYDTFEKKAGVACLLSVVGYLVVGIFNDQVVAVAPLFWIVLGLGISMNRIVKLKSRKVS